MGVDRAALLYPDAAWPARRLVDRVRPGRGERDLFSRDPDGVVWREFCPREGFAQLRVRRWRRDLRRDICRSRFFVRRVRDLAIPKEQTRGYSPRRRNYGRARGRLAGERRLPAGIELAGVRRTSHHLGNSTAWLAETWLERF